MMKVNRKKLSLAVMQALSAGALASLAAQSAHGQVPVTVSPPITTTTRTELAVYGADAVAGVVNFIMRDNFEGVQGEVNYGFYNHDQGNSLANIVRAREATNPAQYHVPGNVTHDGDTVDANLLIGGNFANGRG